MQGAGGVGADHHGRRLRRGDHHRDREGPRSPDADVATSGGFIPARIVIGGNRQGCGAGRVLEHTVNSPRGDPAGQKGRVYTVTGRVSFSRSSTRAWHAALCPGQAARWHCLLQ
jgi:hypothetical protein